MAKEKKCNCCDKTTKVSIEDFGEIGWSAFQIPAGRGKVLCFCPDHYKDMRKQMEEKLKKEGGRHSSHD